MRAVRAAMRAALVGTAAACAVVGSGGWSGQAAADLRVTDVEVSDDGVVSVVVVVPELRGSGGDPAAAFEVRAGGEPQDVDARPVPAGDLAVALVVDTASERPVAQLRELQNIAAELALRLPRDTPMALVTTGDPAAVEQAATPDVGERVIAAGGLEPGGERAAYDALVLAVDELTALPGGRRSVVVIGAGDDRASSATRDDVVERLRSAGAALYIIQPAGDRDPLHALADVATATGGRLVVADDEVEALDAAALVLADLLHQYRLTFAAPGRGDMAVSIRVATDTVSAETTLTVALPAPRSGSRSEDETEVLATGSPSDTGRIPGLLPAAGVAVVTLVLAGTALLVARPRARPAEPRRRHSATRARRAGTRAPAHRRVTPPPAADGRRARGAAAALRATTAALRTRVAVGAHRSAALAAAVPSATARTTARPLRAVAAASRAAGRRLDLTARAARPRRRADQPAWRDVAAQVHREVGGDAAALREAADRITSARGQTARDLRAAALGQRLAAVVLTALPVAVGVLHRLSDPTYLERLTAGAPGWLSITVAATLTVAGGLWLRRVAKPPYSALPAAWRAHDERAASEQRLADGLDRAHLYAVAGLDLEAALERALPAERHPAHPLLETMRSVCATARGGADERPVRHPGWLAVALRWHGDAPAADVLAFAAARLRTDSVSEADQQARGLPVAALLPFVVCILPAALLLGLAPWS